LERFVEENVAGGENGSGGGGKKEKSLLIGWKANEDGADASLGRVVVDDGAELICGRRSPAFGYCWTTEDSKIADDGF
jgi:hypothetical protein